MPPWAAPPTSSATTGVVFVSSAISECRRASPPDWFVLQPQGTIQPAVSPLIASVTGPIAVGAFDVAAELRSVWLHPPVTMIKHPIHVAMGTTQTLG